MLRITLSILVLVSAACIAAVSAAKINVPGCGKRPILENNVRIVNGQNSTEGDWPWMVSLSTKRNQHFCGGTLINEQWVVTATHCFLQVRANNIVVHIGHHSNVDREEWSVNRTVSRLYKNQQFSQFNARSDIALMKLSKPVEIDNKYIIPVCLDEDGDDQKPDGREAVVTGWGDQGFQANNLAPVLQEVKIDVLTKARCQRIWGFSIDPSVQICAGELNNNEGPCLGDSGGPLVSESTSSAGDWYLHGIVSFGMDCTRSTVFTRVKAYLPWMYKTMGLE